MATRALVDLMHGSPREPARCWTGALTDEGSLRCAVVDGAGAGRLPFRIRQRLIGAMIRALFFGLGAFVGLWGASLVAVDGVLLSICTDEPSRVLDMITVAAPDGRRMIDPPDWVGFTLVGMGGLTMLYSVALPRS